MGSLRDTVLEVELAHMELAESLGLHQDDIPSAAAILTKLAVACHAKGVLSRTLPRKRSPRTPTNRMFTAAPREDETPRVAVIYKDNLPD